ncbi:MAG TPA: hypothetical protein PKY59_16480 [Pyrinomonadaceae bacterium]|nr:hypothetical protein [Pyrinomonadaceae bacterium]
MKINKITFPLALIFGLLFALSAFAQSQTFSDENADYTFDLPNTTWKMAFKPTVTNPNVEYIYGDRRDGYLKIRKLSFREGDLLADLIEREEQKIQFSKGFVAGKQENFSGNLDGTVFNYEFLDSGRSMSGRYYFLKADKSTVYVLMFTGERDKLRSIRNYTDSIARTFELKKSK